MKMKTVTRLPLACTAYSDIGGESNQTNQRIIASRAIREFSKRRWVGKGWEWPSDMGVYHGRYSLGKYKEEKIISRNKAEMCTEYDVLPCGRDKVEEISSLNTTLRLLMIVFVMSM